MAKQKTIARVVALRGNGITGASEATVSFHPALPNTGIVFERSDLPDSPQVRCSCQNARVLYRWTSLVAHGVQIEHTEHALAAVAGLDLDNVRIELAQPSVPVMPDYSGKEFVQALLGAGIVEQAVEKQEIMIRKPVFVGEKGRFGKQTVEKLLLALPYCGRKLTYVLDYPGLPQLWQQTEIDLDPDTFVRELSLARSFVLEAEVAEVRHLTGSASDNVLVVRSGAERTEWLWPNELARHKALDLLGDLTLLGKRWVGHVIGVRSGHRLNLALCQKIEKEWQNDPFGETIARGRGNKSGK